MIKIAILTNLDTTNYGNRLQNYAAQMVYNSLGVEAETLKLANQSSVRKIYRLFRDTWQKIIRSRRGVCLQFSKYIRWSKYSVATNKERANINKYYNYISAGSDQIWNVLWTKDDTYFLPFIDSLKRISYAASFGITEIPIDKQKMVKDNLLSFKAISVREDAGAKIVKDLTGCNAKVLIDPTLMLDKKDWTKIERRPRGVDLTKPYILTYFLENRTDRIKKDIDSIAEKNSLQIFNLLDKSNKSLYATGPSEFIYLIHQAKLIMTDSFHACVFSFLFEKPFLLYNRVGSCDMMSRLDTLFNKLDLKRKYVDSGLPNEIFECDYSVGYSNLQIERAKARNFLKQALDID